MPIGEMMSRVLVPLINGRLIFILIQTVRKCRKAGY